MEWITKPLPELLSDVAKDLQLYLDNELISIGTKRIEFIMWDWAKVSGDTCLVCLAGFALVNHATIVKDIIVTKKSFDVYGPDSYDDKELREWKESKKYVRWDRFLSLLNNIRIGSNKYNTIKYCLEQLKYTIPGTPTHWYAVETGNKHDIKELLERVQWLVKNITPVQ